MKLVLLAAGHGRRFGGLKQVFPVGPRGEAIMDYTVRTAETSGYDGVVLVVRDEIRDEIADHVRKHWPSSMDVEITCQPDRPGTAYAVLAAQPFVDGPFAVANADDIYEADALETLRRHFSPHAHGSCTAHALVAYELTNTVMTSAELKRGICSIGPDGSLVGIAEHRVRRHGQGNFEATPLERALEPGMPAAPTRVLSGLVPVSMNLWGFTPAIFANLAHAVAPFEREGPGAEILLPEVVGASLVAGECAVRVLRTSSSCYGVTHREDVELVRACLERGPVESFPLGVARSEA